MPVPVTVKKTKEECSPFSVGDQVFVYLRMTPPHPGRIVMITGNQINVHFYDGSHAIVSEHQCHKLTRALLTHYFSRYRQRGLVRALNSARLDLNGHISKNKTPIESKAKKRASWKKVIDEDSSPKSG